MNIRLRLTLWYTVVLFLILAIFSAAVYLGLSRSLFVTLDNHLQREAGQIIGSIEFEEIEEDEDDDDHINSSELEIEATYEPEEGVFWRILDSEGHPIVDPGYFDAALSDPGSISNDHTQLEYAVLAGNIPIRLYTAPFVIEGQGGGIVQVAESYRHIQEVQQLLIFLLAIGIPFTLLATSAGGWFLASHALDPIDRITSAARQISASDLHRRLNLDLPNDEVGRLARTFDDMLVRLEDAFERQKRFIADASHEMRTPLTILKGDVEVALNRPRSAEEYRETLEMVNQTTDRLAALVEELLLLARADNKQAQLKLESFNLSELLSKETAKLIPRAVQKNITLNLDTPPALPIEADPGKLARLFMNLIDNAIKYATPGDSVTVTVSDQNGWARVAISDTGPGIPPDHLSQLFERFYRIDKARSRRVSDDYSSSGSGLGLSIAQWLAQVHHGRIEVDSRVGEGATFIVWLPVKAPVD